MMGKPILDKMKIEATRFINRNGGAMYHIAILGIVGMIITFLIVVAVIVLKLLGLISCSCG